MLVRVVDRQLYRILLVYTYRTERYIAHIGIVLYRTEREITRIGIYL